MARELIDFDRLAAQALQSAETLVEQWLPDGKSHGNEFKALNPRRADKKVGSFSINLDTGAWGDFATSDAAGKDLVSLCAYLFHDGDQVKAAYDVAQQLGLGKPPMRPGAQTSAPTAEPSPRSERTAPERKRKTPWVPVLPVPVHATDRPVAHPVRGLAERVWCYRGAQGEVLGYIYRFRTSDGGKEIVPLTWCRHEVSAKEDWRWISFPEPRPLYGLDRMAAKPEAWVLMTEGEKCADVADEVLPEFASASWPGGGKAVGKADFSPMAGRKVLLWPDADAQREKLTKDEEKAGVDPDSKPLLPLEKQPGWKTMIAIGETLVALGCEVEVIYLPPPGEMAGGWDIADAVEEGTDAVALQAWIAERRKPWAEVTAPAADPDATSAGAGEEGDRPAKPTWWDWLLRKNGEIHPGLTNVYDCLLNFPEWKGVVAFDEFSQRTVKLKPPPYYGGEVGEWDSTDDSRTAMWLTRKLYSQVSSATVLEAVETLAKAHSFHPVRDWLNSLPPWDGVRRIDRWLHDYLNVPLTEYSRRVSAFFLRGMIARVMNPGCKFDYCLVLEGQQGKGKSTAVSILGGLWYGDTDLDLSNKDSMAALLGKWVYEFSEMGSVTRAEASKQKSFLSRQRDDFRPVYARRQITIPRQVVFVGTINEWEWNKDPTGGRRFWPVEVAGQLDLDGLREVREQLFAEALHDYRDGKRYWPTPDEQQKLFDPEQLKREQGEGLVDALHDWVYKQVSAFSIADAVMSGLNMDASKLTRDMQTRVGIALRKLGCGRVEKRNGTVRYWYTPPVPSAVQESATGGQKTTIQTKEGEVCVPF